jgi:hypothetical protein
MTVIVNVLPRQAVASETSLTCMLFTSHTKGNSTKGFTHSLCQQETAKSSPAKDYLVYVSASCTNVCTCQAPQRHVTRHWNCADHPSHTPMNECDFECVTRDAMSGYAIQLHTLWSGIMPIQPLHVQTFHHCFTAWVWHVTQCIHLLHAASICMAQCIPFMVT